MTWREIGVENYRAAKSLQKLKQWRSSASRSYYAAYSVIAGELEGKASYPHGLQNPPHESVPKLVMNRLTSLRMRERRRVSSTMVRLFLYRVDADYRPRRTVDRATAASAAVLVTDLFKITGIL